MKEYIEKLLERLQAEIRQAKRDSDTANAAGDTMWLYHNGVSAAKLTMCNELSSILCRLEQGQLK